MVLTGGPAMVEAAQAAATSAVIWVIIVVAVLCLAFWLIAVLVADRRQAKLSRRRIPDRPGAVLNRSVPRARRAPDAQAEPVAAAHGPVTQARGRHARPENGTPTEAPPSADLLGRQEARGRHALPRQRSGDADRVEWSLTGPGSPDRDDGEYW
jgi:hypothetical protein